MEDTRPWRSASPSARTQRPHTRTAAATTRSRRRLPRSAAADESFSPTSSPPMTSTSTRSPGPTAKPCPAMPKCLSRFATFPSTATSPSSRTPAGPPRPSSAWRAPPSPTATPGPTPARSGAAAARSGAAAAVWGGGGKIWGGGSVEQGLDALAPLKDLAGLARFGRRVHFVDGRRQDLGRRRQGLGRRRRIWGGGGKIWGGGGKIWGGGGKIWGGGEGQAFRSPELSMLYSHLAPTDDPRELMDGYSFYDLSFTGLDEDRASGARHQLRGTRLLERAGREHEHQPASLHVGERARSRARSGRSGRWAHVHRREGRQRRLQRRPSVLTSGRDLGAARCR